MKEKSYLFSRVNIGNKKRKLILNDEIIIDDKIDYLKKNLVFLKTKKGFNLLTEFKLHYDIVENYLKQRKINTQYFYDFYGFCCILKFKIFNSEKNIDERKVILYFCNLSNNYDKLNKEVIIELKDVVAINVIIYIIENFLVELKYLKKMNNIFNLERFSELMNYEISKKKIFFVEENLNYKKFLKFLRKFSELNNRFEYYLYNNELKSKNCISIRSKVNWEEIEKKTLRNLDKDLYKSYLEDKEYFLNNNGNIYFGEIEIIIDEKRLKIYVIWFSLNSKNYFYPIFNLQVTEYILFLLNFFEDCEEEQENKKENFLNISQIDFGENKEYFNFIIDKSSLIKLNLVDLEQLKVILEFYKLFLVN